MIKLLYSLFNNDKYIGIIPRHAILSFKFDPLLEKYFTKDNINSGSFILLKEHSQLLDSEISIVIDHEWLKREIINYVVLQKHLNIDIELNCTYQYEYKTTFRNISRLKETDTSIIVTSLFPSHKLFLHSIILYSINRKSFDSLKNNIKFISKGKQYIIEFIIINRYFDPF